ncbi:LamG domain-containing protein [Plantactinospora sp. S1510]|uniref:LamG domain-containing protein n=1 Tax=Plantactinospora alkalitolerans TaxID=2789879 RepID=A0ABS0GPI7_9ACTN|nr:LamG domain-containing protein [Plantactinospora alkalitolerans]MBF9127996.1 LamG domain-containing protein [Plantactinospora alkalitolerans]
MSAEIATYPEVLPGVDLVVRATRTGFTHVLAIKTEQAAGNPALRQVRFNVGGDVRVVPSPDGGLRALAGDVVLAEATPAVMWDSTQPSGQPTSRAAGALGAATESSPTGPGDAALTAPVDVDVTHDGGLVLRPDEDMLTGERAVFPVFVDPPWSTGKSRWSYATHNNSSNGDIAVARVGLNPDTGVRYRSYFDFPLSAIGGKHIRTAHVYMKLDHSWSCADTITYLWHTGPMSSTPRASWAPRMNQRLASAYSHGNEADGCEEPDADQDVNFESGLITTAIQNHAEVKAPNITMGFCACSDTAGTGESTGNRWKKFFPNNAKLIVDYSSYPGKPHSLQAAGRGCATGVRTVVGTMTPNLSAVFPDADTTQALRTAYEWLEIPAGGVYGNSTPRLPAPAGASVPANGRSTTASLSGLVNGRSYAFRAMATDPAPYNLPSEWSAWCEITIDTTVPDVSAVPATNPLNGPGEPNTFTLSSNTATVTKFRYGWTYPPTKEVAATGTGPRTASITVAAPNYGENVLYISATNTALSEGHGSTTIIVDRPSPPVAKWRLDTYPGVDQAQALDDVQEMAGKTPLAASNVTWKPDVRIVRGASADFNGTTSAMTTTGPLVDTSQSFSVAAWVRLSALPTADDIMVAAQDGTDGAGFHLGTRLEGSPLTPRWAFVMKDTAAQSSATRAAVTTTAIPAGQVGRWTHIAGVYDKVAGKLRLFIDGILVAEADRPVTPWQAGGRFVIGRGFSHGTAGNWWKGAIADAQVFDRVLVEQDFTGRLATDSYPDDEPGFFTPVEVGRWGFENAFPCYEPSTDPLPCQASDDGPFNRRLTLTPGSLVGYGYRGSSLLLDGTHFADDPADPHYGEATQEYGRSQNNAGTEVSPDWRDGALLRTDDSFTVSVWGYIDAGARNQTVVSQSGLHESAYWIKYAPDSGNPGTGKWSFAVTDEDSTTAQQVGVESPALAEIDGWVHLVGVYDAGRNEIRLYVNGEPAGAKTLPWRPMASVGPMQVGRTLWHDGFMDYLHGGVDDLRVYQGAMTDAAVSRLFDEQALDPVEG